MAIEQRIRVLLTEPRSEKCTGGEIRVQRWDKRERTTRAFKMGGLCWGAAMISVILPLLHFFLVPAFIIAGPIVVFILIGQESVIVGGEGNCPNCTALLPISRASYQLPLTELCTSCQRSVTVEKVE